MVFHLPFQYSKYHKKKFHAIQKSLRDEDKNFMYIWLVFYIIRLWGTLRFFLIISHKTTSWGLYMDAFHNLQALGDPAQIFCNFLLLCVFDKTVRQQMIGKFKDCGDKGDDESEKQLLDSGESEKTTQIYESIR